MRFEHSKDDDLWLMILGHNNKIVIECMVKKKTYGMEKDMKLEKGFQNLCKNNIYD